jgi:hypothetical protein
MSEPAKIIHKDCGQQVAWFYGSPDEMNAYASDIEFMDGTQPEGGEKINIKCKCGENITNIGQLDRVFNND